MHPTQEEHNMLCPSWVGQKAVQGKNRRTVVMNKKNVI